MDDFFKKFGSDKKRTSKHKNGGGMKNPFANLKVGGGVKKFSGQGQSLGGSKPGQVLRISLVNRGSLGIKVEKTQRGGAIVASVVPASQAADAGLVRGDIICIPNSCGEEEMHFEQFMALAASERRPLMFDVRRIVTANLRSSGPTPSRNKDVRKSNPNASADADARRQAVIAAAEARDRVHKNKTKRVSKVTSTVDPSTLLSSADRRKLETERKLRLEELQKQGPQTKESRNAVIEAKRGEELSTQQLGFNLYETNSMTSGQAKTATVDMKHGSVHATETISSNIDGRQQRSVGNVQSNSRQNQSLTSSHESETSDTFDTIDESFDEAFSIFISSNEKVGKSLSTMHTLIMNAITKGQIDGENSTKYRRVRLSNKKINDLIVSVHGAVDILMLCGFVFHEEDNETFLIYPMNAVKPGWLENGLKRMKQYQLQESS